MKTDPKSRMRVPACDLTRWIGASKAELMGCIERVLDSGRFILGPEVVGLEQEIAARLGAPHAVGVASGTDALWLALKAAGLGAGDRVLTSPFTFFATASAVLTAGAEPIFADIEGPTFNLDPEAVAQVLEGRSPHYPDLDPSTVKALIPVHLYGQPADMVSLNHIASRFGLAVIEDAAQAIDSEVGGVKAGTLGDFGCFSFFPTKNLGGFGDGGMVLTQEKDRADRLRSLRAHGSPRKYHHEVVGTNSRLDALQAAILRLRLPHLSSWIAAREAVAGFFDSRLNDLPWLQIPARAPDNRHAYNQYTVRVAGGGRDRLQEFLAGRGIDSTIYYPVPLHLQKALAYLGHQPGCFPRAEEASREVLSLPIFPEMTEQEMEWVAESVRAFRP